MKVNITNIVSLAKDYSSYSTIRRLKLIYMQFLFLISLSENKMSTQIKFLNYCHKPLSLSNWQQLSIFTAFIRQLFSEKSEAVVTVAIFQGSTR